MGEVVQRYASNPILTPEMIPGANAVFNSGVAQFRDGYVGVFRVEKRQGYQSLRSGFSKDGITFDITPGEVLVPTAEPFIKYEEARSIGKINRKSDRKPKYDLFCCIR